VNCPFLGTGLLGFEPRSLLRYVAYSVLPFTPQPLPGGDRLFLLAITRIVLARLILALYPANPCEDQQDEGHYDAKPSISTSKNSHLFLYSDFVSTKITLIEIDHTDGIGLESDDTFFHQ